MDSAPSGPRGCQSATAPWIGRDREAPFGEYRPIWMSEFFNRSVGDVIEVGHPMPYALPHVAGTLAADLLVDASGRPLRARFVLVSCSMTIEGRLIARDVSARATVYRLPADGTIRLVRVPGSMRCTT